VSGRQIVGVISAADLMVFLAQLPGVPSGRVADDESDDDNNRVPDVESDAAAQGMYFSDLWDDVGADTVARMGSPEMPEWDLLADHDVSEVMTHAPLHTVIPDDSAEHAALLMQTAGIHRVLVIDDDQLVGIVSSLDIVKAAADHRFSSHTYVFNHDRDFGDRRR
jgi:signal-transduction protein with cAMP-binding, CBS, and nucleotidyltransferase domain